MSTQENEALLERAAEIIYYFEGRLPAKLIEKALDDNDLELVEKLVSEAEGEASRQEFAGEER